jgi:hypothetical protein
MMEAKKKKKTPEKYLPGGDTSGADRCELLAENFLR